MKEILKQAFGILAMELALLGCQREPASAPHPAVLARFQSPAASAETTAGSEERPSGSTSRWRTDVWDFGLVAPSVELRHRYTIQNASTSTWTIKHATPSCACTLGEFTAQAVKPGQATSVDVTYRAGQQDGEVYEAILVEFAEPTAPLFNLVLRGEIRSLLSPAPARIDFGRVTAGAHPTRSLQLRNYSAQDVAITQIQAPDWLQIDQAPVQISAAKNQPRQAWKIQVHADANKLRPGTGAAELVIHSSAMQIDPVVIPVHLEIRNPLEITPKGLDFRVVRAGSARQQALLLDISPELGDVSEKDLLLTHNLGPELQMQVFKIAGNRFRLIGIFLPKKSGGAKQGELKIVVRGKMVPELRVPISAVVP